MSNYHVCSRRKASPGNCVNGYTRDKSGIWDWIQSPNKVKSRTGHFLPGGGSPPCSWALRELRSHHTPQPSTLWPGRPPGSGSDIVRVREPENLLKIVSSRNVKETTFKKSQQIADLISNTSIGRVTWQGGSKLGTKPRQYYRQTRYFESWRNSLSQGRSLSGLSNIDWSILNSYSFRKHYTDRAQGLALTFLGT